VSAWVSEVGQPKVRVEQERRIVILNGTPGIKNHPKCYEKKKEMHVQEVRTR
jgi:hypothetical protein